MRRVLTNACALLRKDLRDAGTLALGGTAAMALLLVMAHEFAGFQYASSGDARGRLVFILTGLVGLALAADLFESDRRHGTLGVLRAAPVRSVEVLAAKFAAMCCLLPAAWCLLSAVDFVCLQRIVYPYGHASDFESLLGEGQLAIVLVGLVVVAVFVSALVSILFQHALAAAISGLLTPALPLIIFTSASRGNDVTEFAAKALLATLIGANGVIGAALLFLPLIGVYRLRGRASHSTLMRVGLAALVVPVSIAAPSVAGAISLATTKAPSFDEPLADLVDVALSGDGGRLAVHLSLDNISHASFIVDLDTFAVEKAGRWLHGIRAITPWAYQRSFAGWSVDDQRLYGVALSGAGNDTAFPAFDRNGRSLGDAGYAEMIVETANAGFRIEPSGDEMTVSREGYPTVVLPRLSPIHDQPVGDFLYFRDPVSTVYRLDARTSELETLPIDGAGKGLRLVSPDGRWFLLRGKLGEVKLWSLETYESWTFTGGSPVWTKRELPLLLKRGGQDPAWWLVGPNGEREIDLPTGIEWRISDIDGERWLLFSDRGNALSVVGADGSMIRELRSPLAPSAEVSR